MTTTKSSDARNDTGASSARETTTSAPSVSIPVGLEQIREILFGAHYREIERRVVQLESRHDATMQELRTEVSRRLDALEAHVQREAEALASRLAAEHTAQLDALKGVSQEGRETLHAQESRLVRLEESTAKAQRDLRQTVLDQAKDFLGEIRRARDEMRAMVSQEIEALGTELGGEHPAFAPPSRPGGSGTSEKH